MRSPIAIGAVLLVACGGKVQETSPPPGDGSVIDTGTTIIDAPSPDTSNPPIDVDKPPPPPPPLRCSTYGTWDVIERDPPCCGDDGSKPAFHFTIPMGGLVFRFWGGPPGSDPTKETERTMEGTYSLKILPDGATQMTLQPSYGMGCTYDAQFKVSFDETCSKMSLDRISDGCTGARWYIIGHTLLEKR